jgi:hypothetical protein
MILFCKCLYGIEAIIIKIRTLRKQKKNNLISPKRKSLLKGLTGIVVHGHGSLHQLPNGLHGLCNQHHWRELKALIDHDQGAWAKKVRRHPLGC